MALLCARIIVEVFFAPVGSKFTLSSDLDSTRGGNPIVMWMIKTVSSRNGQPAAGRADQRPQLILTNGQFSSELGHRNAQNLTQPVWWRTEANIRNVKRAIGSKGHRGGKEES